MAEKILLDTDIGSDIDDAVCLAYLLAQSECELMGISTVSGESNLRAQMCSSICLNAGKKIPIFPGIEQPFLVESRQPHAPQAAKLVNWDHQENFPQGKALNFLQEMIHSYPHEIILLPIGPLTNIGLLFSMDPEIPALLKALVLMGGKFSCAHGYRSPEWNIWNDPHAAELVYRARPKVHRSVGTDVTMSVSMDVKEVKAAFSHPFLAPVVDYAGVWFEHTEKMYFHDPLAAAVVFDPSICDFERGEVEIELESRKLQGYCHWQASVDGSKEVAVGVDPEHFFTHFFQQFVGSEY